MTPLSALRLWLAINNIAVFIIPSTDPHQSEYIADHWKCRQWLTGFTGSNAMVVVTADNAALWTDARYYIQAENELDSALFTLQKSGLVTTPSVEQWIVENTPTTARVGLDGRLFTKIQIDKLRAAIGTRELVTNIQPFDDIWKERPAMPNGKAFVLDEKYAGESVKSKIERMKPTHGALLIGALDDIAWLLNIRGGDVECTPVLIAYASVDSSAVVRLFADSGKFTKADIDLLTENGVVIYPYSQWESYISSIEGPVIANPERIDYRSWSLLKNPETEKPTVGVINEAKAIKNETEINGFRRAMVEDGIALCRFMIWMEQNIGVTEYEASNKLTEFRALSPLYRGDSFHTIMAYGANGAMAHYTPTADSTVAIGSDNFLLIDSGGQYLCGTTDITRTYHTGEPDEQQKRDYTNVLMGTIELSSAVFPEGTRGAQIDILARMYLWRDGDNYMHGTSHGVGHFLSVHEGPQSIRMNDNPITIKAGMVNSIEPAIYRQGKYGIRTENLVATMRDATIGYLRFETLSLAPICTKAINKSMMLPAHVEWLNSYHDKVYDSLAPMLNEDEKMWLKSKTNPI